MEAWLVRVVGPGNPDELHFCSRENYVVGSDVDPTANMVIVTVKDVPPVCFRFYGKEGWWKIKVHAENGIKVDGRVVPFRVEWFLNDGQLLTLSETVVYKFSCKPSLEHRPFKIGQVRFADNEQTTYPNGILRQKHENADKRPPRFRRDSKVNPEAEEPWPQKCLPRKRDKDGELVDIKDVNEKYVDRKKAFRVKYPNDEAFEKHPFYSNSRTSNKWHGYAHDKYDANGGAKGDDDGVT